MSANALFSFLARANPPEGSAKYLKSRYDLVVFIRATDMADARQRFRRILSETGWTFPEITELAQVTDEMKLAKANPLTRDAMAAAIKDGSAIVVFSDP